MCGRSEKVSIMYNYRVELWIRVVEAVHTHTCRTMLTMPRIPGGVNECLFVRTMRHCRLMSRSRHCQHAHRLVRPGEAKIKTRPRWEMRFFPPNTSILSGNYNARSHWWWRNALHCWDGRYHINRQSVVSCQLIIITLFIVFIYFYVLYFFKLFLFSSVLIF